MTPRPAAQPETHSLTGTTGERVLFVLYGAGRNGKSTFMETIHALLGDYAKVAPAEMLMARRYGGGIPNDVAALKGARFVSASETAEGRRLDETKVKQLTGGDTISARFLHAEFFTFRPQFKLWLATNHKPTVRGTDDGIWDRIRLVPFSIRIPDTEVDRELPLKLRGELSGILAWAVRGCRQWQRDGRLGEPDTVRAATAGYRAEMDVLAVFLRDRCVALSSVSVPVKDLHAAYRAWCEENGEYPLSQRELTARLKERGFDEPKHRRDGYYWIGLGLRDGGDAGDADCTIPHPLSAGVRVTPTGASRTSRTSPALPVGEGQTDGRTLIESVA